MAQATYRSQTPRSGTYPTGNYVVATGLSGSTQTVTVQGVNQRYGSFAGFEIVNTVDPASPMVAGQRGDALRRFDNRRDRGRPAAPSRAC